MDTRTLASLRRGAEAGLLAGIPQVLIAKLEEKLFLPRDEDADLGPRLIEALAARAREPLPEDIKWLAAAAFHFGYSGFWGALYATLFERHPVRPWVGGLALAGVIHLLTFPSWGGAVLTGAEPEPRNRSWRKEAVLVSAPLAFGLGTALIYGRGPGRTPSERLRRAWRKIRS